MLALMKNHFSPYIYKFNTVGQIPYFYISLPFYIGGKRDIGGEREGDRRRDGRIERWSWRGREGWNKEYIESEKWRER